MKAKSKELRAKKNTVKAMVTMFVSVTYNGDVKKSNDVAIRRNGLRYSDRLTCSMLHALCSMLCAICLAGCGYTIHSKMSLPFDSIQVGKIENTTLEPKLQDKLQMALTEEFLKQGMDVNPNAGYKLSGTINQFELRILSEKAGIATEYEVIIKGDFSLVDPSGNIKDFKNIGSPFIVSFQSSDMLEDVLALKELVSERAIKDMATEIISVLIYPR